MNAKYKNNPEVIATIREVDANGEDKSLGDKVTGIMVQRKQRNTNGLVQIDVRGFNRETNLVIEIELPELAAALTLATLNSERD